MGKERLKIKVVNLPTFRYICNDKRLLNKRKNELWGNTLKLESRIMQIVGLKKLNDFWKRHRDAGSSISTWRKITSDAEWRNRSHVLRDFPKAKILKYKRARFEISGKRYRMVCEIDYADQIVEVRWIGTHDAYNKIDPTVI
ncbi:type II toxin-antitoxin system HigB family toxin [Compostibacter hankyongensis]|uniref:Type II toxin-antitoxin system HigB family toxin n=1 Tax=Compostibacter hankyongensis TaxID=1007089 RepID=A0ABP8G206_9BACT